VTWQDDYGNGMARPSKRITENKMFSTRSPIQERKEGDNVEERVRVKEEKDPSEKVTRSIKPILHSSQALHPSSNHLAVPLTATSNTSFLSSISIRFLLF
jgi:hypothetical protein